jgi:two-component system nitrogen regulation response regulator GlnG
MIGLPPLRERVEDVSLLVDHFIAVFSREFGRPACQILPEALKILEAHAWPGNVRELQNVVRYALMHARGNCITPDSLPPSVDARRRAKGPTDDQPLDVAGYVRQLLGMGEPEIYRALIDEVDRVALREVLAHVGGNQVQASELLGISRSTLRSKLAELGMLVMKPPLAERRAPEAGS